MAEAPQNNNPIRLTMDKKELKEMFRDFLFNLEKFLEMSALYLEEHTGISVLYLQEPQESGNILYAKGLILIGSHASPIKITFIIDLNNIEIKSKFFTYHLNFNEMKNFLDQIHGGA